MTRTSLGKDSGGPRMRYKIWIDRGGTFTDCICHDAHSGRLTVVKLLSSEHSVIDGIRQLLSLPASAPIPPCDVRMGTTIATNALLERKGRPTLLVVSKGFGDVPEIGTQARPDLFALNIRKPTPLHAQVVEVAARGAPDGSLDANYVPSVVEEQLRQAYEAGLQSVAICLLHAHKNGELERQLAELAQSAGFADVALSHEVAPEMGLLARGDTTTVDAYLTPLIRDYLESVHAALPGSSVRLMQSSGGLTGSEHLRGPHAVLSGPAGGVVAYSQIATRAGFEQVIGFDMGGTSTDVSRFAGAFERNYENEIGGVRLRAPMLAIHTVAAGGGSICRYDGHRFTVGPESAGAKPGPLCYGAPEASELTITDVNLTLGRLQVDRFPFALHRPRAEAALNQIGTRLKTTTEHSTAAAVAEGFFAIANLNMAEAIRQVSVAKGYDVRDHALFVFGGAGGQHACAIAELLGMRAVLFHSLSGVLSAYGMGLANSTVHRAADAGAKPLTQEELNQTAPAFERLVAQAASTLRGEGFAPEALTAQWLLDLRYCGTQTSLTLPFGTARQLAAGFSALHEREFGYSRSGHPVEIVQLRVEVSVNSPAAAVEIPAASERELIPPRPLRYGRLRHGGIWLDDVPIFEREQLMTGHWVVGPALILEATGTIVIDPGFSLSVRGPLLVASRQSSEADVQPNSPEKTVPKSTSYDPVLVEVMNHLYMSIAEQMGQVLRRTALSTNIRERLDFSCAVFDARANLIANAPHIPVHLGAMGESVKGVVQAHPEMEAGDVFISNDPAQGGSHLPDVTIVTPVHQPDGSLSFFVASRGHHADIGGITPGSMPSHSTSLAEEGILLTASRIVHAGVFEREALLARFRQGPYPARDPDQNLADIEAQIAANQLGVQRLHSLAEQYGLRTVKAYMEHVRRNAELKVREAIQALPDGTHEFVDCLDCGARIQVAVEVRGSRMTIDFQGTSGQLRENLNAPRAVTVAAVIYFLRTLVNAPIPLNAGCLAPISLEVPARSLLAPDPERAVVGGNVETSQRIVDVLLAAVGRAAASQGTMNNLSFGNENFGYYETVAGGAGAGPGFDGAWGVHTHMTNTRITDPEIFESRFPVRLLEFSRRRGSGGVGEYKGGDGLVREIQFLEPVTVSLLTERRTTEPFGLAGGSHGRSGRNLLNGRELPGAISLDAAAGDRLRLETPGGGGYGRP